MEMEEMKFNSFDCFVASPLFIRSVSALKTHKSSFWKCINFNIPRSRYARSRVPTTRCMLIKEPKEHKKSFENSNCKTKMESHLLLSEWKKNNFQVSLWPSFVRRLGNGLDSNMEAHKQLRMAARSGKRARKFLVTRILAAHDPCSIPCNVCRLTCHEYFKLSLKLALDSNE